jgi:hypothetical protein
MEIITEFKEHDTILKTFYNVSLPIKVGEKITLSEEYPEATIIKGEYIIKDIEHNIIKTGLLTDFVTTVSVVSIKD